MSWTHFNNSHASNPFDRRIINESRDVSNNLSNWETPSVPRQITFRPTHDRNVQPSSYNYRQNVHPDFLPNRTRNVSNDQIHRRYRLESPTNRFQHNENDDFPHLSSHLSRRSRPSLPQSNPIQQRDSNQLDQRQNRHGAHSRNPSNVRIVRMAAPHHPSSILANFIQSFFGEPFFSPHPHHRVEENPSNPLDPADLISFALGFRRSNLVFVPAGADVRFNNFFDSLARHQAPPVGLSENQIEHIPTSTYKKSKTSKSDDEKCAVCLSEYKPGEKIKHLRCKHVFHAECIDPWLKTSPQCPICRGAQN